MSPCEGDAIHWGFKRDCLLAAREVGLFDADTEQWYPLRGSLLHITVNVTVVLPLPLEGLDQHAACMIIDLTLPQSIYYGRIRLENFQYRTETRTKNVVVVVVIA